MRHLEIIHEPAVPFGDLQYPPFPLLSDCQDIVHGLEDGPHGFPVPAVPKILVLKPYTYMPKSAIIDS